MINVDECLELLDSKLKRPQTLYLCGGAALYLMGYEDRDTSDFDVLGRSYIEKNLETHVLSVAKDLNISEYWLNTQANPLTKKFESDWKEKCTLAFQGKFLKVFILERQLMINTKLLAAVNRKKEDTSDLIWLKPSREELNIAYEFVLNYGFNGPTEIIDAEIEYILEEVSK